MFFFILERGGSLYTSMIFYSCCISIFLLAFFSSRLMNEKRASELRIFLLFLDWMYLLHWGLGKI